MRSTSTASRPISPPIRRDEGVVLDRRNRLPRPARPVERDQGQARSRPAHDPGAGGSHRRHHPGGTDASGCPCPQSARSVRPHARAAVVTRSAMVTASDLNVSRETFEKLELLERELRRWQAIKNLVGPATLDQIWDRHIVDSLQLLDLAPEAKTWLDLGSGAGFPGLGPRHRRRGAGAYSPSRGEQFAQMRLPAPDRAADRRRGDDPRSAAGNRHSALRRQGRCGLGPGPRVVEPAPGLDRTRC